MGVLATRSKLRKLFANVAYLKKSMVKQKIDEVLLKVGSIHCWCVKICARGEIWKYDRISHETLQSETSLPCFKSNTFLIKAYFVSICTQLASLPLNGQTDEGFLEFIHRKTRKLKQNSHYVGFEKT